MTKPTKSSKPTNRKKRIPTAHKPGKNGRVLTAKHLPESVYRTFHEAPHGTRQELLHGVLGTAVAFAATWEKNWVELIREGKVKLVRA